MRLFWFTSIILFNLSMIQNAHAQVPRLVHYQGILKTSEGALFNGTASLKFSIYKSFKSEKAIWSEVHNDVEISDGNYGVFLGSRNPLNLSYYTYFLEVQQEGEKTPATRVTIVGSGYNYRLNFLLAAYTIVWLAIFLYLVSISRRQKRIIAELETVAKVQMT